METFGTPKHCPFPWYHTISSPAYLRMDAGRGSHGPHQGAPRRGSTWPRGCPSRRGRYHTHSRHQLSDVTEGLRILHSRNIVHGDLKGVCDCSKPYITAVLTRLQSNILVDATSRARITDFGLARLTQNLDSMRSNSSEQGFTARWTAPEILNEKGKQSKEADIFSFAMVMIEVRRDKVI